MWVGSESLEVVHVYKHNNMSMCTCLVVVRLQKRRHQRVRQPLVAPVVLNYVVVGEVLKQVLRMGYSFVEVL